MDEFCFFFFFLSFLHIAVLLNLSVLFFFCLLVVFSLVDLHAPGGEDDNEMMADHVFRPLPETEDAFFGGAEPEECGSERLCFCFACRAQFESPTDFATEVTQWCRAL